jgi:hypothetical protein
MSVIRLRLLAIGIGSLLLISAYPRVPSSTVMADAAKAFLDTLTPEQRARAVFDVADAERFEWHYIPKPRKGLPLKDMTPTQKHLAHALLSAGLSQQGYIKAVTIMSLDDVLRILEHDNGERRNPEGYYFSVFGQPAASGTWGYRVEGHHLSQNFTVANGKVATTPSFFGANPAEVREGPRRGLRALAREEDLGRELLLALTPEQKNVAIVDKTAYDDILTKASRKAALEGKPSGLAVARMTARQRQLFDNLVEEYCHNSPDQLAQARLTQVKQAGDNLYFAWAGVAEKGGPHYYRIQAAAFLIEYDDTQDKANHIHTVWRDFDGDFGLDLLKQHYETSHH